MQTLVSLTDTSSPTKWSMLLLLRMLEAANVDLVFTISLKRSTQNLQLSTNRRPITPSCRAQTGHAAEMVGGPSLTRCGHRPAQNPAAQQSPTSSRCAIPFGRRTRGRDGAPPPFRTIQVGPKDLPAPLRQV